MEDSPAAGPVDPAESSPLTLLADRVAALETQVAALTAVIGPVPPPIADPVPAIPRPGQPVAPPPRILAEAGPPEKTVRPLPTFARTASPKSLEDRLGSQLFNFIGIIALIFGSAWALKLAIEQGWIGVTGRVLTGLVAGAGLILWSERFRRKGFAAFSYSLKAVGTGVLYLSLWAAFQLYHLLPAPVALALMILVTAWNAFMALAQDAELLAAYALVGGLLTPVLLSTGGDHETFLFTYLAAIDLGIVALQRSKLWPRLLPPAFLATVAYFIGYYVQFFHVYRSFRAAPPASWDAQSTETALFALIFFGLFALVSTRFWNLEKTPAKGVLTPVLIPLANAAFLGCALYSVFQDSGLHEALAWLMVGLAALFLGLMRLQRTSLAAAMHLACAVIFLTIAIPLKASGHTLTTAWLIEGLVLFWASTRFKAENDGESRAPSRVLVLLSAGGYILGLASVLWHWTWAWDSYTVPPFFSANLGSALVAVAVLAGAVWLSAPRAALRKWQAPGNPIILVVALSAIDLVALLLTLREVASNWEASSPHSAFANPDFFTALVGLALFAATSYTSWRISRSESAATRPSLFLLVAYIDLVLFNLLAILTVEREIGALFPNAEANLQRSLAISAFLMAYGGVLLAIGFWRRNAFVRWQALILILFTIAKVFLFDISGLSAGYRVASFLALGALLLTVSFAYQKDWLGLKTPGAIETSDGDSA